MNDLLSRDYSAKGWDAERVAVFREEFSGFQNVCKVNSKEVGPMILGENLYYAQRRFNDFVFDNLAKDIHDIKHLKSRQLGISTDARSLSLFWGGVHDGLRGYMVFDTQPHCEEARLELIEMLVNLPDDYAFPRIARQNRYMIRLENDTVINFASAGVKETRSTGTLGRSSGINFVHACMAPGTQVIVADGRVKAIEDVAPGDRVLTHTGAGTTVLANERRPNDVV